MKTSFNVNFMGAKQIKMKTGEYRFVYSFLDMESKRTFDLFTVESFVVPKAIPEELSKVNIECDMIPKKDGSGFSLYLCGIK